MNSGFLNLKKPSGPTSRDVVDRVARLLRKTKVGHAGTLDPLATGVLVVAVGAATRLIEYVQRMPKTYRAVVRLGARSDTLDALGTITEAEGPAVPDEERVREALAQQVGTILQRPPEFSALKVGGRRAYDLARAGHEVELAARPVRVDRIEMIDYSWPTLALEIDCGGGTYIRSIARDLGEALGCGGLIEVLSRTRIGPFTIADAIDPEALTAETLPGALRPLAEAVAGLPRIELDGAQVDAVRRGQAVRIGAGGGAANPGGEVALFGPDGALVAIGEVRPGGDRVEPRRVLSDR
jgi:tRNA pseudouridine55 synthase